jgi:hypothetical protein
MEKVWKLWSYASLLGRKNINAKSGSFLIHYIADVFLCEYIPRVIREKVALFSYTSTSQKQLNKKQKPPSARRGR